MDSYNATVELTTKATADSLAGLLDAYADYHPAAARTPTGRTELIVTVPAESLAQAASTVLALIKAAGHTPTRLELLATDDFDRRAGLPIVPDLVSVSEAAEQLGITRQAVLQRIEAGTLPAKKVGSTYAIARAAIAAADR